MSFGKNLRLFLRKRRITAQELADKIGVSRGAVTNWVNDRRFPKDEIIISKIAQALEITEQDLFDYSQRERIAKEEIKKNPKKYLALFSELQIIEDSIRLPFAHIGLDSESFANIDLLESIYCPKKILPENIDEKNTLLCKIVGDSMEPEFRDGDIVFIELANGRDIIFQDGIYLIRYGEVVQIKRVQFLGSDDLKILSFNPDYPPIRPKEERLDWEIIGKPYFVWKCKEYARLKVKGAVK